MSTPYTPSNNQRPAQTSYTQRPNAPIGTRPAAPTSSSPNRPSTPGTGFRPNTPGGGRPPYNRPGQNRNHQQKGPRKNDRIRSQEVRVIGPEGNQIGVLSTREALALAQQHGLDLVEISPTATPPVCRIIDFGKYMYDESKKQKKTSTSSKLKEIKLRPGIDKHDYETKVRHAYEFLEDNDKVKFTLSFRGREMENTHIGFEVIKRVIEDLKEVGTADSPPKLAGRNISLTLSPIPASKRPKPIQPKTTP